MLIVLFCTTHMHAIAAQVKRPKGARARVDNVWGPPSNASGLSAGSSHGANISGDGFAPVLASSRRKAIDELLFPVDDRPVSLTFTDGDFAGVASEPASAESAGTTLQEDARQLLPGSTREDLASLLLARDDDSLGIRADGTHADVTAPAFLKAARPGVPQPTPSARPALASMFAPQPSAGGSAGSVSGAPSAQRQGMPFASSSSTSAPRRAAMPFGPVDAPSASTKPAASPIGSAVQSVAPPSETSSAATPASQPSVARGRLGIGSAFAPLSVSGGTGGAAPLSARGRSGSPSAAPARRPAPLSATAASSKQRQSLANAGIHRAPSPGGSVGPSMAQRPPSGMMLLSNGDDGTGEDVTDDAATGRIPVGHVVTTGRDGVAIAGASPTPSGRESPTTSDGPLKSPQSFVSVSSHALSRAAAVGPGLVHRGLGVVVGSAIAQGQRSAQEDRLVATVCAGGDEKLVFAAVIDGHGGDAVAEWLRSRLSDAVAHALESYRDSPQNADPFISTRIDDTASPPGDNSIALLLTGPGQSDRSLRSVTGASEGGHSAALSFASEGGASTCESSSTPLIARAETEPAIDGLESGRAPSAVMRAVSEPTSALESAEAFAAGRTAAEGGDGVISTSYRRGEPDLRRLLSTVVTQLDDQALTAVESGELPRDAGACVAACLLYGDALVVANVGDCEAWLCRGGRPYELTCPHKAERDTEVCRVVHTGGQMSEWGGSGVRLAGALRVSRSVGMHFLKRPTYTGLISNPFVRVARLRSAPQPSEASAPSRSFPVSPHPGGATPGSAASGPSASLPLSASAHASAAAAASPAPCSDEFIVLGSDGLWDVFPSRQDLINRVKKALRETGSADAAAASVVREAVRERRAPDNVSMVLLLLNQFGVPTASAGAAGGSVGYARRAAARKLVSRARSELPTLPPAVQAAQLARSLPPLFDGQGAGPDNATLRPSPAPARGLPLRLSLRASASVGEGGPPPAAPPSPTLSATSLQLSGRARSGVPSHGSAASGTHAGISLGLPTFSFRRSSPRPSSGVGASVVEPGVSALSRPASFMRRPDSVETTDGTSSRPGSPASKPAQPRSPSHEALSCDGVAGTGRDTPPADDPDLAADAEAAAEVAALRAALVVRDEEGDELDDGFG